MNVMGDERISMVLVFGKGAAVTAVAVASRRAAAIVVFVDLFIVVVLVLVVAIGRLDGIDSEVRAGRAFRLGWAGAPSPKTSSRCSRE